MKFAAFLLLGPALGHLWAGAAHRYIASHWSEPMTQARPVPLPGRSPDPAHRSGEQHRNGGAT